MDKILVVALILSAIILLGILWCLTEPFILIKDRTTLKKSSLTSEAICEKTIRKLPRTTKNNSEEPDFRFFFFSDIHTEWCPANAKRLCNAIRDAQKRSQIDAVLFGGDIVTYPQNAEKGYKYLSIVSSFCKENGIPFYGISGNHDLVLKNAPEKSGFVSLDLTSTTVTSKDKKHTICITGVPDSGKLNRIWQKKLSCSNEHPVLLLAHNPDSLLHIDADSRPDFMLSGHLHGGQMKLPFRFEFNVLRTTDTFPKMNVIEGHFNITGTEVFISRGVGCGILPFRFISFPEATIVEIKL